MHFFLRIFDEFFSGFRAKFQKIVTCVAFSIKFAKTNQKFAENSEFCEKIHYYSELFTSLLSRLFSLLPPSSAVPLPPLLVSSVRPRCSRKGCRCLECAHAAAAGCRCLECAHAAAARVADDSSVPTLQPQGLQMPRGTHAAAARVAMTEFRSTAFLKNKIKRGRSKRKNVIYCSLLFDVNGWASGVYCSHRLSFRFVLECTQSRRGFFFAGIQLENIIKYCENE